MFGANDDLDRVDRRVAHKRLDGPPQDLATCEGTVLLGGALASAHAVARSNDESDAFDGSRHGALGLFRR
jgi:hypothetical protein